MQPSNPNSRKDADLIRHIRRSPSEILHFSVASPNEWRILASPIEEPIKGEFRSAGLLRRQGKAVADFEVKGFWMPYEMHTNDLHLSVLLDARHRIVDSSVITLNGFRTMQTVSIEQSGPQEVIHHSKSVRFGSMIYLLDGRVESTSNQIVEQELSRMIETFRPLHPERSRYAEAILSCELPDFFMGRVFWLASWSLTKQYEENGSTRLVFSRMVRGNLMGSISISMMPARGQVDPDPIIAEITQTLHQRGFDLKPWGQLQTTAPSQSIKEIVTTTTLNLPNTSLEAEVRIVSNAHQVYVSTLVGPSKSTNLAVYSMNRRCTEIMRDTYIDSTKT